MGTTAGLSLGNSVLTLSGIFFVLLAVAAALLAARYLRDETAEKSAWIASNYMGALGTLFAILTAFMINTEYSSYRQVLPASSNYRRRGSLRSQRTRHRHGVTSSQRH